MTTVFMKSWQEVEHGKVTVADGYSLHVSTEAYQAYVQRYAAGLLPEIPAVFSKPDATELKAVEIPEELAIRLAEAGTLRFPGNALVVRSDAGKLIAYERNSTPARSFMELCLAEEARPDDIDSFVEKWHNGAGENISLSAFLGMTPDEYAAWAIRPSALHAILAERQQFAAQ